MNTLKIVRLLSTQNAKNLGTPVTALKSQKKTFKEKTKPISWNANRLSHANFIKVYRSKFKI
jgi:hypothetical protein